MGAQQPAAVRSAAVRRGRSLPGSASISVARRVRSSGRSTSQWPASSPNRRPARSAASAVVRQTAPVPQGIPVNRASTAACRARARARAAPRAPGPAGGGEPPPQTSGSLLGDDPTRGNVEGSGRGRSVATNFAREPPSGRDGGAQRAIQPFQQIPGHGLLEGRRLRRAERGDEPRLGGAGHGYAREHREAAVRSRAGSRVVGVRSTRCHV